MILRHHIDHEGMISRAKKSLTLLITFTEDGMQFINRCTKPDQRGKITLL